MIKMLIGIFVGVFIEQDIYELWQLVLIFEWQGEGDFCSEICIGDILSMLSGLCINVFVDLDYDVLFYVDYYYFYIGIVNLYEYVVIRLLQWLLNMVGCYCNIDLVFVSYFVCFGVEGCGDNYYFFLQWVFFD